MQVRFEKSGHCPTAESLLALLPANPDSAPMPETQSLVEHLASCEFCELTLELLRQYPASPSLTAPPAPPVPAALLRFFTTKRKNK